MEVVMNGNSHRILSINIQFFVVSLIMRWKERNRIAEWHKRLDLARFCSNQPHVFQSSIDHNRLNGEQPAQYNNGHYVPPPFVSDLDPEGNPVSPYAQ